MDELWARNGTRIGNSIAGTEAKVPLADGIVRGELAMGLCGLLSTISTTILFLWITYKLLRWQSSSRPQQYPLAEEEIWGANTSLGLPTTRPGSANDCVRSYNRAQGAARARHQHASRYKEEGQSPNSFLILIYNLLLGDINQSIAFTISIYWFKEGKVLDDAACWAQGWFINSGRLSTAVFVTLLSLHTFSVIVLGRVPRKIVLYISIACLWTFTYLMTAAGIILTRNGKGAGGWYIPLTIWCWVNDEYNRMRFWMEYFWIFLSISLTTFLYTTIFVSIYLQRRSAVDSCRSYSPQRLSRGMRHEGGNRLAPPRPMGHHPAFLVYPLLYLVCTVPVGTIRLLADAGYDVGLIAGLIAGVMVALHGALNVLLWALTLVYLPRDQLEDVGLSHFMRTPANRQYGNMVWIQGGFGQPRLEERAVFERQQHSRRVNWFGQLDQAKNFCFLPRTLPRTSYGLTRGISQISLRRGSRVSGVQTFTGDGIHMDTVTTVVEEHCDEEITS